MTAETAKSMSYNVIPEAFTNHAMKNVYKYEDFDEESGKVCN